jgi:hypothetical protein
MRGAERVQHSLAAHTMPGAQRVGRIVQAGVDHFAVARGDAVSDAAGHFGDGDLMAGLRRGARDGQSDHAGTDHQNLHRGSLVAIQAHRFARPWNDYIRNAPTATRT